jgi:Secretion system C-terminal sorting domain
MKNAIIILALTFVSIASLFSQPHISTVYYQKKTAIGTWENESRIVYQYDDLGRQILSIKSNWDIGKKSWLPKKQNKHEYLEDGREIQQLDYFWVDSLGWVLNFENTDFESLDGCVFESIFWWHYTPWFTYDEGKRKRTVFKADCKPDTIIMDVCGTLNDLASCKIEEFQNYHYSIDGKETTINKGYFLNDVNEWQIFESAVTLRYNEQGWLLENLDSFTDIGPEKWNYSYYENGEIKTRRQFNASMTGWELVAWDSFIYGYDDNGMKTQMIGFLFDEPFGLIEADTTYFTYYCDYQLHTVTNLYQRTIYEYFEGANCPELQAPIELTLSPTLVSGTGLKVSSSSLTTAEGLLRIYNSTGQLVVSQKIGYRTDNKELDVSLLPNGVYFLNLTVGREQKTGKFAVQR